MPIIPASVLQPPNEAEASGNPGLHAHRRGSHGGGEVRLSQSAALRCDTLEAAGRILAANSVCSAFPRGRYRSKLKVFTEALLDRLT
eukprot:CAMPEP_0115277624 /NCGR_PEP_ID=MMETSP0270-20121206/57338_1 /TAXON_ID=71861 /ORGANISM="Scrippsiella trochoidea, Strain CCMP3099" /LENGTH=86 /DNA_ID=CAMNT_0002694275 /DNA_START=972 /DNA_END=1232 /DNA_ORIENTATION=-